MSLLTSAPTKCRQPPGAFRFPGKRPANPGMGITKGITNISPAPWCPSSADIFRLPAIGLSANHSGMIKNKSFLIVFCSFALAVHKLSAGEFPDSWTWDDDPKDRASHTTLEGKPMPALDRKSTRLNSSHLGISYAVFCLKKKK